MSSTPRIEPVSATPSYLLLSRWSGEGSVEIVSRRRLDTRQVVPIFEREGVTYVGVLERARLSRAVRGVDVVGWEPIGIDFGGVDETGDILEYGRAIFSSHSRVEIDAASLKIALPSVALSIGYLTELALPLFVHVIPPVELVHEVSWDGLTHLVRFLPVTDAIEKIRSGEVSASELLYAMLLSLAPTGSSARPVAPESFDALRRIISPAPGPSVWTRSPDPSGADLRFLKVRRVSSESYGSAEVVTPGSGVSVALFPRVERDGVEHVILWCETRVASLERRHQQPIFDLPVATRFLNATACYVADDDVVDLVSNGDRLNSLVGRLIERLLGSAARVSETSILGPALEPAPALSSEVRHRVTCRVDASVIDSLPADAILIPIDTLSALVGQGFVRDPVIALALLELRHDPFAEARRGEVEPRLDFLDTMTRGSIVQRRLRSYSSIEAEQLGSITYRRLMTRLQHEHGVRIVYPRTEEDRKFFKAAFRVFMADDRNENRALQGLHWSHDAFHFALGNFTLPPPSDDSFARWYVSGDALPDEGAHEGEVFTSYVRALKRAEDEATFFSFWTLYAEQRSLTQHVKQLTFWEALTMLGVYDRATAWEIYYPVVALAQIPDRVKQHPVYEAREDIRGLFEYMRGFKDWHLKDILPAWKFASRDMYRGYFTRYAIYEHDVERYIARVERFCDEMANEAPGLNPLLCACADAQLSLRLRVWDIVKSLRLVRAAIGEAPGAVSIEERQAQRRAFLDATQPRVDELDLVHRELVSLRAQISDAELVPRNERIFEAIRGIEQRLEVVRTKVWDGVASTGWIDAETIREERGRELPR